MTKTLRNGRQCSSRCGLRLPQDWHRFLLPDTLVSVEVKHLGYASASRTTNVLALLCLFTTLGILFCTLWPFDPFPPNRVSWLAQTNGIRFGQRGVVVSQQSLGRAEAIPGEDSCSIELWIRPVNTDSVATVLDIYEPGNPWRFLIRQYHGGLIISHDVPVRGAKPHRIKIDIDDGLQHGQLTFLTITSGVTGTRVYFDAKLKKAFPGFQISRDDLSGQLVLGSSTVQPDAWSGEMHGLALYSRELNPQEVLESYTSWTKNGATQTSAADGVMASYPFAERSGNIVRGQGSIAPDLLMPKIYRVPHHSFLTPPWREFDPSFDYLWDLLRNIAGFMPLGFFLCALFQRSPLFRRAVLYTTLLGGALSLCIEILQAYIPQRGSGVTDVITNTLGTALGALLVRSKIASKLVMPQQKNDLPSRASTSTS
jgi:VanZ family protein